MQRLSVHLADLPNLIHSVTSYLILNSNIPNKSLEFSPYDEVNHTIQKTLTLNTEVIKFPINPLLYVDISLDNHYANLKMTFIQRALCLSFSIQDLVFVLWPEMGSRNR